MKEPLNIQAAKYLSEELSDTEKTKFLEHLKSKPELEQELFAIKPYWKKIKTNQYKFDTEAAWSKLETRLNQPVNKHKKISKRALISLAAGVAILFGLSTLFLSDYLTGNKQVQYIANARKTIELPDHTKVILKKDARLILAEQYNKQKRSVKLKGEAFFEVTPNKSKPFIIHAVKSTISVLGTSFGVSTHTHQPDRIVVKTGKVSVKHKTIAQTLVLNPGEYAVADNNTLQFKEQIPENYLSWALHEFHFSNTHLKNVMNTLGHAYNQQFVFADTSIAKLQLSATFEKQSLKKILNIIAKTHKLAYKKDHNKITIKYRH